MAKQQLSTSPSPADANRQLAALALQAVDWDAPALARQFPVREVRATKAELERSTLPLTHFEPTLDGSMTATVRRNIETIGAKIRPDLSVDQGQSWINAMVRALSDLPPQVAAKATNRAVHIAFEFVSEVEGKVRELAEEHMARIRLANHRLAMILKALDEAVNGAPRIIDDRPPEERQKALTDAEVHELQRGGEMQRTVLRLGLAAGHIKSDQLLPPDDPTLTQEQSE